MTGMVSERVGTWGRMVYRVHQVWHSVAPQQMTADDWQTVLTILTTAETTLFCRFGNSDRKHSIRVLRLVQSAGGNEPALWKAALLHDVGKTKVRLTLWDRVVIVLGGVLWPGKTAVWGNGAARGWRRPFVVKTQHPTWGAEMAAAAGCDTLTVTLIRRHQDSLAAVPEPELYELLRILQWADDQS